MVKINSTAICLSLILTSIENDIASEIKSQAGKGALHSIQTTLLDLLKREKPSAVLLQRSIEKGNILKNKLLSTLNDPASVDLLKDSLETDFEALLRYHAKATKDISELCDRLSESDHIQASVLLREAAEWELSYEVELQKLTVSPYGKETLALDDTHQHVTNDSKRFPLSKELLQQFLSSRRGPLEVKSFSQLTGGYGKQTYQCDVQYENSLTERFIIRKSDATPIISFGMYLPHREYDLLRDLSTTNFLSPKPYELCHNDPVINGSFYTMKYLPGTVPSSFLGVATNEFSLQLVLQLGSLLAQLHGFPLTTFASYLNKHEGFEAIRLTVEQRNRQKVKAWREYIKTVTHLPSPYLVWLLDWVERHIPADGRTPVLTHGDFNFHNLLVENNDITGVLDWECADFGAPELDLAYIQPLVKRHMAWDIFLEHYYKCGGKMINENHFPFVQAYGVVEKIIAFNKATLNNQNGESKDIRFVMVGYGINAAFMSMGLSYTLKDVNGEVE